MTEAGADRNPAPPVLELRDVTKSFPGVRALRGVSLSVRAGEIHALVGENGAGKSTLIKIATGAHSPDGGTVAVDGAPVTSWTPREMQSRGVRAIFQERQIAPDLSVAENLLIDGLPTRRFGIVDWRATRREASARLARIGVDLDPAQPARLLSVAHQQLLEIARAVSYDARLIVMDEPTASLHRAEIERLFTVVRSLRDAGVAILYISHHLDEIFAIADAVTVLRDGERVGEHRIAEITPETIVGEMFGRSVGDRPVGVRALTGRPPRLVVSNLHVGARVRGVDLEVEPGEIVAVTGGIGAGTSELARAIVGASRPSRGEVRIDGRSVRSRSSAASMVGFLPADRKRLGLLLDDSVADNLLLGSLAVPGPWLVRPGRDRRRAEELRRQASVKTAGVDVGVRTLSGGNQQKVIIGRWLALGSPVLVFDEPTAGIDISSKFEIYTTLRRLADEGAAIVVCTTDFQEVRQVADRVIVLRSGRVVGSCAGADATEHRLVELEMAG